MRPLPAIEKEPIDKALELAALIATIIMVVLPAYYWTDLPSIVPTHFNASGEPDDYGSKWAIITLPVIGAILFAVLLWINRFPHKFNYAQEITEDNAQRQYRMATRLIRILAAVVAVSFAYLTYTAIATIMGNMPGPGRYFAIVFTAVMLVIPITYLLISRKAG